MSELLDARWVDEAEPCQHCLATELHLKAFNKRGEF
jgi:hypothetical protein